MRLCFGLYASVLDYCRQHIYINQQQFISRIIKAVDPKSTFANDKSAISRLLRCQRNFTFADRENAERPTLDTVIKELENKVIPFIEEDKKAKVILTLLGIIQKDSYIDTEKQEIFKMYFGVDKQQVFRQSEFMLPDFLGRILLYTACGNIDNTENDFYGESVKEIISNYISNIAKPYTYDYQWDISTQTLELSFVKIFNIFTKAVSDFKINDFIAHPVTHACLNYPWMHKVSCTWADEYDSFREFIESNILVPFGQNTQNSSIILKEIQQFSLELAEYSGFLRSSLPPLALGNHYSLDSSRWEEQAKWNLRYTEKTENYMQQLQSIYHEICNYATPCYIQEVKSN